MLVLADVGTATALLQTLATALIAGTAVAAFILAARGVLVGRGRGELEANALMSTFWGGLGGCFCLLYDLVTR